MNTEPPSPTLVVGADNLIGRSLVAHFRCRSLPVIGTTRRKPASDPGYWHLDLAEPTNQWVLPPNVRAAILCAGLTNLQQCQVDPAGTRHINCSRISEFARRLADQGAFLVFLSTNMVFDGSKPLRRPEEPVSPNTEYGRQKAETEAAILSLTPHAAVARLSKVFHRDMPLLLQWQENLRAGKCVDAFSDLYCSPLHLDTAVEGIATITERNAQGIWHFSPQETLSYSEVALFLAQCWDIDALRVHSMPSPDSILEQRRPRWTSLDSSSSSEILRIRIPSAPQTLSACK